MAKKSDSSKKSSATGFAHDPVRVLVAWTPNSTGSAALDCAAWLSRTTNVEVRCVTTFLRPWPSRTGKKIGTKYKKWFKKEAAACEEAVKRDLTRADIAKERWNSTVSVFCDGTNEAALLSDAAADFRADIVILGSDAAAPKGRFLAGSTADALLHSSPKPLALTPRKPNLSKRGVTRVNFAYTGDDTDSQALIRAAILAAAWNVPLRVLALSPSGFGVLPISDSVELPRDIALEWRENTLAVLDRARDTVHKEQPEVNVETHIGSGAGWQGAIDAVKWKKGDLLCFGSTPLGAFERVFIGSQATEILPYVSVPVLMIPATSKSSK